MTTDETSSRRTTTDSRPYHHGDLRDALLAAAESVLAESGATGFSLRATARRAGVSHAAPAHHFGDVNGLLAALCERGFRRLTTTMIAHRDMDTPPTERLLRIGAGYVAFAQEHPALFELMFGGRMTGIEGSAAGEAAFGVLLEALGAVRGHPIESADDWRAVAGTWSAVHGLAHLAIAGRMRFLSCADERRPSKKGVTGADTISPEEIVRVLAETLGDGPPRHS